MLDKFIVSEEKISPVEMAFYSSAPLILLAFCIPFVAGFLDAPADYFIALVAGATFVAGMWTMYMGYVKVEASHMGPFVGAALALAALAAAATFGHETISGLHTAAVIILALGSLIISFEQDGKRRGWHLGMLWGVAAGVLFAISNVTSKLLYDHYGFWTGIVWTRVAMGVCGVLLVALPSFPRHLLTLKPATAATGKKPNASTGKEIVVVVIDKIVGVLGVGLVQFAIALGSVAVVSGLGGAQYAFLIILIAILTKFFPALFKEDFERGEFAQEIVAVFFIAAGVGLLLI